MSALWRLKKSEKGSRDPLRCDEEDGEEEGGGREGAEEVKEGRT